MIGRASQFSNLSLVKSQIFDIETVQVNLITNEMNEELSAFRQFKSSQLLYYLKLWHCLEFGEQCWLSQSWVWSTWSRSGKHPASFSSLPSSQCSNLSQTCKYKSLKQIESEETRAVCQKINTINWRRGIRTFQDEAFRQKSSLSILKLFSFLNQIYNFFVMNILDRSTLVYTKQSSNL